MMWNWIVEENYILHCNNISQYYCIFYQIYAAIVSTRHLEIIPATSVAVLSSLWSLLNELYFLLARMPADLYPKHSMNGKCSFSHGIR